MNLEKNVLAIVVTYNRKKLLKECLTNLFSQKYDCDVLVVDNCSTDGTKQYIRDFLENKKLTYVNTGANLGGAGGFNFALKYASDLNYEYFWIMDDDTMPPKDCLSNLINAANDLKNDFGFLCSYAKFTDGNACLMNVPLISDDWYNGNNIHNSLIKVKKATFVSFFLKKEIVEKVGLPIKDFFIWGDDSEYTQRISRKTDKCYMVLNSLVTHKMKSNKQGDFKAFLGEEGEREKRFFFSVRNRFFIARQKGGKEVCITLCKTLTMLMLVPFLAKSHRVNKQLIILKGITKGMNFNPKIEFLGKAK
ncbi:glycosyltransferase [Liquorilactobacillus sucicola DSM 21376 = JCM 15457]|uniref:Glycosyltransferase n=1 Tax=Liquorilactobacillus sucicola DSM 21376 = JCM 15457 TaxID=1423806 RepID=A0A023CXL1_9LACO|nr:glycosyltransferase family 2 protein [Liquorilactobacillus sucicola]KRN06309.1 glycosyltransferase [Liquorilactobacillus sucicola DSM 21376 = JCM 15457]GAJ26250.1 glycosyltransferase [Liquorilactobacillus sucicola DSM 21376 = JCM 15457]